MSKQTHVVPNPNGGWDVKQSNSQRVSKHFDNKKEAVAYGRESSKKKGSEFIVHNKDGKIAQKDSHGNDDYLPKG